MASTTPPPQSTTTSALILLDEVGEVINADAPLDVVLNRIATGLARLVPGDSITVALAEPEGGGFAMRAAIDGQGQIIQSRIGRSLHIDQLPTLQSILKVNKPLYLPNIQESPLWTTRANEPDHTRAFLGAPLVIEQKTIGLLLIDFVRIDPLTEELRYAVLAFARYAAAAIRNAQQRERLLRSEERYRVAASLTTEAIYELGIDGDHVNWLGDIDGLLQYAAGTFKLTAEAWLEAIHPNDRKRVQEARQAVFNQDVRLEEEYRLRRSDGSYCYILDRAVRFGSEADPRLLGTISDLSNTYELTDALVESEVRYRMLFTRSLDAIFVTDTDGILLDLNPAAEALTGSRYSQLVSTPLRQVLSPQNIGDFTRIFLTLRDRGEVGNFETRFARPNGNLVDAEMWGSSLGGGMFQFVAHDVSLRQQSQLLAAQRVAELTALNEVTQATTAGGDVIEILNRVLPGALAALEMPLGCIYLRDSRFPILQLIARVGYGEDVVSPAYLPSTMPLDAAETGLVTSFSPEVRIVEHPPSTRGPRVSLQVPLSSNTNLIGLVIFSDVQARSFASTDIYLMDIIGRQLSIGIDNVRLLDDLEQLVQERTVALFTTEMRYRSLIEQVPGVVYTADTIYNGLSFISSGTETLFGIAASEFIRGEGTLLQRVKPDDLSEVMEQIRHSHELGTDFDARYRVTNVETGTDRWVHHHARQITAGTGEAFWLGLITDVTELKELDEMKSRFVATVSHELRTPLSAIKLRAATLRNYYDRLSDEQRLDMVQRINFQADILADLIEDVLRLAKLDGGAGDRQIEEVELSSIGSYVVEELIPSAEAAGLSVEAYWDSSALPFHADPTDLTRIWRNLVSNAVKYTPRAGFVRVYTGRVSLGPSLEVTESTLNEPVLVIPDDIMPGDWFVGVVSDTGKGISASDQVQIFTRFFRGEAALTSIPGTGLGLSLVKELLEDYGGYIALRSLPEQGSTFAFWLPAAATSIEEH